ncbi:MAG: ATP-binding protein [Planctomycetota bacterium]
MESLVAEAPQNAEHTAPAVGHAEPTAPAVGHAEPTAPAVGHAEPGAADQLARVLREYMAVTERLQQTHAALQHEVARLRAELASKDRELELRRRLAALGELAAGIAHEVRNPLGAIQLYSGLLKSQCLRHRLEPGVGLVEKIEAGIQAIEAVVQDTLALAPRERQLADCCLADVIERVRDATLKTLTVCEVSLAVRCDDPAACVRADPDGLQRVLINLIVNAAEASPAGRSVHLHVAAPRDSEVTIRVLDEGLGLPDEVRHRIFDPFFTTKEHGTGLGLTIAHRLTEAYGGRLTADNRPEGGAAFIVVLPAARAESAPHSARPLTQPASTAA